MKISFQWLNEFVSMDAFFEAPASLVHLLAQAGLEVEAIEDHRICYKKICIGKILKKEKHPNAQRLNLCEIQVSQNTDVAPISIICGATNHAQGDKVVVALPGAVLPSGITIKKQSSVVFCRRECFVLTVSWVWKTNTNTKSKRV